MLIILHQCQPEALNCPVMREHLFFQGLDVCGKWETPRLRSKHPADVVILQLLCLERH